MRRRLALILAAVVGGAALVLGLALPALAHDVTATSAVCTGPNAADFSFTFANFGSESRFIKVYKGGVLLADAEGLTGDGVHVVHIDGIDTGSGNQANVQFHFESDAVVNISHDISVDFTLCQPTTTTGGGSSTTATTLATTTTHACEEDEDCASTTTATTLATTTTATTIATTTTAQQTTTTAGTTTIPVTNPCPGSGCPQTTPATTTATTTPTTSASTTVGTTTTAAPTTIPDTDAADQTLAPTVTTALPVTGSDVPQMLMIGFGAALLGGSLLILARKP